MQQNSISNILNQNYIEQSEQTQQKYYEPQPFNINSLKFNPQKDSYISLVNLPINHTSNIPNNQQPNPSFFDLNNRPNKYIFSKQFGQLTKSHKWNHPDYILIGRSQKQNKDADIQINDKRISFIHCKVYLAQGWNKRKRLNKQFVWFLLSAKQNQKVKELNNDILKVIWDFVKPQNQFYMQDMGSSLGTSIKIKVQMVLKEGMVIRIPSHISISIVSIKCFNGQQLEINSLNTYINKNSPISQGIIDDNQYNLIVLQVMKFKYIYFNHLNISLGRHQSNDIVINQPQVSKRHCCISFNGIYWIITDGISGRVSSNGIWRDIRTINQTSSKLKSSISKLQNNDEIMLGKSFLKFNKYNC